MEELRVRYQCQLLKINEGKNTFSYEGEGGQLIDSIGRLGLGPLLSLLPKVASIECVDNGDSIVLKREGNIVDVVTIWKDGTNHKSTFTLPEMDASDDKTNVVESTSSKNSDTDKVIPSVVSLQHLNDPSIPLWTKDGSLYQEPLLGASLIPALTAKDLGQQFCEVHQVCAPYIAGAMAGGIASVALVRAMSQANMLSFFGAGGLAVAQIERALQELSTLSGVYGCNLLHNPQEPNVEEKTVDLYIKHEVRYVSASAYVRLTPALVRYRLHGIKEENGSVYTPNRVFAKVSHPSVAARFLSPPPAKVVQQLLRNGLIDETQAELAGRIPMAEDVTIEADSGGHTDRRPLSVIVPVIRLLRDQIVQREEYSCSIRVGAAGGLGDPASIQAAFALGADYVLLGSVHQATVEAGTSSVVKDMLAQTTITDCAMGAAPDMFELGASVQVLSKGTMYATRSNKLREIYRRYDSISDIPKTEVEKLERTVFKSSLQEVWTQTKSYWSQQDAKQLQKASESPKHKMALIFRWYLGLSSRWARAGDTERRRDYQIWCGPSMGLFNAWAANTPFADSRNRTVVDVSRALLKAVLIEKRKKLAALHGVQNSL